jgi:NUMOD4 motif/HNH endonuclease
MDDATPERWLPVPGYEDLYEASDLGRVRSLRRNGLILKPSYSNTGGYALVLLYSAGHGSGQYIHRLVATAFIGPCPDGMETRHRDNDPTNNALTNLIWGTSGENKLDQVGHGTHPEARRDVCDHGHEFTPGNTYIRRDGRSRACRACHNEATKKRHRERAISGTPCTVDSCDGPQVAKGLCRLHYGRQWRAGQSAQ